MNQTVDARRLAETVRELVPLANGAVLTGSAATRVAAIEDLDVTCLLETVEPSTHEISTTFGGRRLDVLLAESDELAALLLNPDLYLLVVREARKILQGKILFDDGTVEEFRRRVCRIPVPLEKLAPVAETALHAEPWAAGAASPRLELHLGLESLVFCWLHLDIRLAYSKPKWIREDIRQLSCPALEKLGDFLAREARRKAGFLELTARFRESMRRHAGKTVPTGAHHPLHDAEFLISAGRPLDASWPLRMAAFLYGQWWAQRMGIEYRDLRSNLQVRDALLRRFPDAAQLLTDLLSLDSTLPGSWRPLWDQTKKDFREAWRTVRRTR